MEPKLQKRLTFECLTKPIQPLHNWMGFFCVENLTLDAALTKSDS